MIVWAIATLLFAFLCIRAMRERKQIAQCRSQYHRLFGVGPDQRGVQQMLIRARYLRGYDDIGKLFGRIILLARTTRHVLPPRTVLREPLEVVQDVGITVDT